MGCLCNFNIRYHLAELSISNLINEHRLQAHQLKQRLFFWNIHRDNLVVKALRLQLSDNNFTVHFYSKGWNFMFRLWLRKTLGNLFSNKIQNLYRAIEICTKNSQPHLWYSKCRFVDCYRYRTEEVQLIVKIFFSKIQSKIARNQTQKNTLQIRT